MRRILFIAYCFPPANVPGSYRIAKFVKYIGQFGWLPIVLTAKKSDPCGRPLDFSLMNDIPQGTTVIRSHSIEPLIWLMGLAKHFKALIGSGGSAYRLDNGGQRSFGSRLKVFVRKAITHLVEKPLSVPDPYLGWVPFAALKCVSIFRKHRPDIIFTSSPPLSCHLVGLMLKKIFDVPWVADFRDVWPWLSKSQRTPFDRIENYLVEIFLRNADKIITVSNAMNEELFLKYASIPREKYEVITNGFDPDDYMGIAPTKFDRFTILHAGEVFLRDPNPLLDALRELVTEGKIGKDFQVIFLGTIYKSFMQRNDILKQFVELKDPVAHDSALSHILGADVLLLLMGERKDYTIGYTSKFFEYLFASKPILAISPEGPIADLIRKAGAGFTYRPEQKASIKQCLLDLYSNWESGLPNNNNRNENVIGSFHREVLTEQLMRVFNKVHSENNRV